MNVFKIYASNIKKFRKAKSLSQAALAEKIDLSVKYVSDLETGRSAGSLETLTALAAALDVEPYEMLMSERQREERSNGKARELFSRMRGMYLEFVDTLEKFLRES